MKHFFWLFIFSVVLAEAWIFICFDFAHCSNGKSSMNGVFYYSNHAENMHRTLWKCQRKNRFKVLFFSIQSFSSRVVIILVCRSDHNRALKAYVLTEMRACVYRYLCANGFDEKDEGKKVIIREHTTTNNNNINNNNLLQNRCLQYI